ncbi:MAG: hypothetical protein U0559_10075 [Anaerolineae bacterium]
MSKKLGRVQRFLHWLFGSPFENQTDVIGDPVPPELRAFEARSAELAHHVNTRSSKTASRVHHSKST